MHTFHLKIGSRSIGTFHSPGTFLGSVAFCCAECGRIFAERENQALRSYGDKWFFDRSWCGACVQKGVAFWPTTFLNSSERELGFLPIEILAEEFLINSGAPLNVN